MHKCNLLNRPLLILLICSIFFMSITAMASYPKTFTDTQGREITLDKAVERIITRSPDEARIVVALGYGDKLIAGEQMTKTCLCPTGTGTSNETVGCLDCYRTIIGGRMPDLPETSTRYDIYYEQIAALKPDIIFCGSLKDAEAFEEKIGCPIVVLGGQGWNLGDEGYFASIRVAGEALDAEDKADELISFIKGKVDLIKSVTDKIKDKPKVYFASRGATKGFYDPVEGRDFTRSEPKYDPLTIAGGVNVASEVNGSSVNIALEQIIAWDPDYILIANSAAGNNTGLDFIKNCPELASINAVKNGKVYNCFSPHCRGTPPDRNLLNMIYMAKLLHPDEFKDLDIEKEGNEIFKAFLGVDNVFTEYADYLVWPREYLDSL